ncbi:MAG: DUF2085 domain-containing protein [Melioribacteraceae bacterium]|nr:DUF2085 domain-containing protein [Melioribacteraceae bacterium]MCF8354597.1 DUF2085 domain-containing protein [Melioribacteraceae bacterium]MCF8394949.1 DUF2085 domain-containing protein [Melioribacteraceae bacterium]MCF8420174.1 DUF2085 domain-containing protein [Melioribacteraceae bacterium]
MSQLNEIVILLPFVKSIYGNVCHQDSAKVIEIAGISTLVCSRCLGIYSGALISSILILITSGIEIKSNKLLFIFAAPMIIDVAAYSSGLYSYNKTAAFVTGLLLGSICFYYFYKGLTSLLSDNNFSLNHRLT